MKNVSHNPNYLLQYSRFELPQRSHVLLLQKRKLWRLHEPQLQAEYQNFIKERPADVKPGSVEDARNKLKDFLLRGEDKVYDKQREVEYVTTKLGGGTMQLMMLLKRNEKNKSSGN